MTDSGVRATQSVGFDDFVAARSNGLLRTAYLLTRDEGLAEDLLRDRPHQDLVRLVPHRRQPRCLRPPHPGVAAVAAAAIAVVGVVALFPRNPEAAPTDRELAGYTAPKTIDSLGMTFEFAKAV